MLCWTAAALDTTALKCACPAHQAETARLFMPILNFQCTFMSRVSTNFTGGHCKDQVNS